MELIDYVLRKGRQAIVLIPEISLTYQTVMRFFAIDSMAFDNIRRQSESVHPDIIEVLPGLMPKVIRRICTESRIPVIAGGLITDREDIMAALNAGAISISTTNRQVWFM